jgi:hypothetical protein
MDVSELGMHAWELDILCIVDALQRTKEAVTTKDIYTALEKGTFKELAGRDLREVSEWGGGRPAYQYAVRSYLSRLARGKNPDLVRVSWGVYRMTEKGKQRIKHNFL